MLKPRPRVIVSLLPQEEQGVYLELLQAIVEVFIGIDELHVCEADDLRVLLLPDLCLEGLGDEIDLDVELPTELQSVNLDTHQVLAERLCKVFKNQYPEAVISYRCEVQRPLFTLAM